MKRLALGTYLIVATSVQGQSNITIDDLNYGGTGCPLGTVGLNLSDDREAFTLTFSEFIASTDDPSERRKICDVNFNMNIPRNWAFAVYGIQFRGYAFLEERVQGVQDAAFVFDGNRTGRLGAMRLDGLYEENYERSVQIPLTNFKWFGCKQRKVKLRMRAGIQINANEDAEGFMTIDSIDGDTAQTYGLLWKRCDETDNKTVVSCKIALRDSEGKLVREKLLQAQGANLQAARRRMLAKESKLCQKANSKYPKLSCGVERPSCKKIYP
ncbi:DUF4360 domain-containing protein [Pseudobacteriovorax antillogorgiicola]|uniref:DUF4360 domain-containing protein n=1 Tax=Pseudobacteriovorax antillogorgiicola TaxID=1513793 RepID=A0A1Y6CJZ6_9BACT|nr:DUF4360 domain-containing protein [Pseudobacteriovorax antillogorgiicola]TCS45863.1 uncharacterized protein DUF4360 [Pseudobacteriovorax antillogorgiicola]SMF71334.1 protein of unknown function [Pseudobacteriovorax antillogorgiicola]